MSGRTKLPVFATLTSGFSWPFKHVSELIKIFALPSLLIYGPLFYLLCIVLGNALPEIYEIVTTVELSEGGAETLSETARLDALGVELAMLNGLSSLFQLAGLVVGAMIGVPLTRSIALGEAPGLIRFDSKVWWYVLAQVVFPLLFVAVILGFGLVFGGGAAFVGSIFDAPPAAVAIGLIGFFGALYVLLRLSLFLPAVAAEGGLPIPSAWAAAGSNTLRLFGLWFFSAIVFMVIVLIVIGPLIGIGALLFAEPIGAISAASNGAGGAGDEAAMRDAISGLIETALTPLMAILLIPWLLLGVYTSAVSYALPAFAYGTLKDNLRDNLPGGPQEDAAA